MSKSSDLDVGQGEKTVTAAGTREPLFAGRTEEIKVLSVTIKALSTNTGKVYIGDHTVASTNGFDLDPRDSLDLSTDRADRAIDLSKIFVDAAVNGEGVRFIYLRE